MIYKLCSCLSILLLNSYGNEIKDKKTILTQNFKRPDIPISFVHDRKRDEHLKYPAIQYAPLNFSPKPEDCKKHEHRKPQESKSRATSDYTERYEYTKHENLKYDHLEPKRLREDDNTDQKDYRSFISGHNVEVLPETTKIYSEQSARSFVTHKDFYENEKVKPSKFVYYQKDNENFILNEPKPYSVVEQPEGKEFKFLEFLPADFISPVSKKHARAKSLPIRYSLHNQLAKEKQEQSYPHSRIHLNIARSYNIAKQPQEKHLPPLFLAPKTLSITSLVLKPQNTLMLPVGKRNYLLGL